MTYPVRDKLRQYPANTEAEARISLRNLEHDQLHRFITPERYVEERRRLIRIALVPERDTYLRTDVYRPSQEESTHGKAHD